METAGLPPSADAQDGAQSPSTVKDEKRRTRLRFKEKRPRSEAADSHGRDYSSEHSSRHDDGETSRSHHHRHRRHHHRSHGSKRHKSNDANDSRRADGQADDDPVERPYNTMDPDAAFRESLFDAMADDEAADYWQGVYGQPVHTYPNVRVNEEKGELERMDDDEYVAYVRARMWEKTHEHVIEERMRREEALKRRKESERRTNRMKSEKQRFDREMEESLRRGLERKKGKLWKDSWERYLREWDIFNTESKKADTALRIPWPVKSGKRQDVNRENVEEFFSEVQKMGDKPDQRALLKVERVRWHPDKMQQRFGARSLDEEARKAVTAVFQVVDNMWSRKDTN